MNREGPFWQNVFNSPAIQTLLNVLRYCMTVGWLRTWCHVDKWRQMDHLSFSRDQGHFETLQEFSTFGCQGAVIKWQKQAHSLNIYHMTEAAIRLSWIYAYPFHKSRELKSTSDFLSIIKYTRNTSIKEEDAFYTCKSDENDIHNQINEVCLIHQMKERKGKHVWWRKFKNVIYNSVWRKTMQIRQWSIVRQKRSWNGKVMLIG